jgi:hypothetical protein
MTRADISHLAARLSTNSIEQHCSCESDNEQAGAAQLPESLKTFAFINAAPIVLQDPG